MGAFAQLSPSSRVARLRRYVFLRDICVLSWTAFGGSQAHFPAFLRLLVEKRGYLSARALIELQALCQILPGPTSTQTLIAIAYQRYGAIWAYVTLLLWCFPAVVLMGALAVTFHDLSMFYDMDRLTRFIQPMGVAFVAYAVVLLWKKAVTVKYTRAVACCALWVAFFLATPYVLPLVLLLGGVSTGIFYKKYELETGMSSSFSLFYLLLWVVVLGASVLIACFTEWEMLGLFRDFYLNGSWAFGGGQVFMPFLFTEYVETRAYLSAQEFLSGFALMQSLPGPIFAFSAYVGAMSMREYGVWAQILAALVALGGIFLPGTFLVLFALGIWNRWRRYRFIRAAQAGIIAVSVGALGAAALRLWISLRGEWTDHAIVVVSLGCLIFARVSPIWVVGLGIICGVLWY